MKMSPWIPLILWLSAPMGALAETLAPPALALAQTYRGEVDLSQYWVSEKYDGVRAYWDGHALISRNNNLFQPPAWFTRDWPEVPMDGELWMGRGRFSELNAEVRRLQPEDQAWRAVRFMVFDLPAASGPFDRRLDRLQGLIDGNPSPYLVAAPQRRGSDHAALMQRLDQVLAAGGEGLMLHLGSAPYRPGRTPDLLKVKRYEDAEARVVAHLPGKGQYAGLLGALLVEDPEGRRFRIGTGFDRNERAHPPAVGAWVTYRYLGRTAKGLPRFPSFWRLRPTD